MMEGRPDSMLVEQAVRGDGDSFTELCRRYYGAMVAIGHAIIGDRHLAEDAAQQAFAKAAVNLPKLRDTGQFGRWVAAICRNEARDLARALARVRRESRRGGVWPTEQAACVEGVPPSNRGQDARDTGTPSERGRDARDTGMLEERGQDARDTGMLEERGQDARDTEIPSERGQDARDTEIPSERGQDARDTVKEALNKLPAEGKEVIFLRFYDGLSYEQISAVLGISEQAINGRLRRAKRKLAEHLRRSGFDEVDL
jgi:RNA polymerase sigma factor (sigma-70 family)